MKTQIVIIESEEIGISFNGSNPKPEHYFTMSNMDEAVRIKDYIDNKFISKEQLKPFETIGADGVIYVIPKSLINL